MSTWCPTPSVVLKAVGSCARRRRSAVKSLSGIAPFGSVVALEPVTLLEQTLDHLAGPAVQDRHAERPVVERAS